MGEHSFLKLLESQGKDGSAKILTGEFGDPYTSRHIFVLLKPPMMLLHIDKMHPYMFSNCLHIGIHSSYKLKDLNFVRHASLRRIQGLLIELYELYS